MENLIKANPYLFISAMFFRDLICKKNQKKKKEEVGNFIDEVWSKGVAVAPIKFDDAMINDCIRYIDENIKKDHKIGSDYRIFDSQKNSKVIDTEFATNPLLFKIAECYLQSKIVLQTTLAAKLTYEINNLGSGQGWHRDSYSRQFKAIVYLTDVGMDNGPFEYIVGSHKYFNIIKEIFLKNKHHILPSHCRYSEDFISTIKDQLSLKSEILTAPKGTVIVADTRGLHRGMPILSGVRYALTNYYIVKSQYQI